MVLKPLKNEKRLNINIFLNIFFIFNSYEKKSQIFDLWNAYTF